MKLIATKDASHTLFSEIYKEHYHSVYGALDESYHIFIKAGLRQIKKDNISIFEMGFGTGLNAFLSLLESEKQNLNIVYTTIEKHPVPASIYRQLNYAKEQEKELFLKLHQADWQSKQIITPFFSLIKTEGSILNYQHQNYYDLIYYDAFSPEIQPDLWSEDIFLRIYEKLNKGGILMTYTVKGTVKRALKSVGFKIEKLPGPIGKREILKAYKS